MAKSSITPAILDNKALAEKLHASLSDVLTKWLSRVGQNASSLLTQKTRELILTLSEALKTAEDSTARSLNLNKLKDIGFGYGLSRKLQSNGVVSNLAADFSALRQIILIDLCSDCLVTVKTANWLSEFLDFAVLGSTDGQNGTVKKQAAEIRNFAAVLTKMPIAIAILKGPEHIFEYTNELYDRLVSKGNLIGRKVVEAFPEVVEQGFVRLLDEVYNTGQTFTAKEMPIRFVNRVGESSEHFLNFTYDAYFDEAGAVAGILAAAIDITEQVVTRKKVELAKHAVEVERENLGHLFQETSIIAAMMSGPEHRFVLSNPAHQSLLGKSVLGMTVREAQPESLEVHALLDEVFRTGKTISFRQLGVTVRDRHRYFDFVFAARFDAEGRIDGTMAISNDVTEHVEARQGLENQRLWLEKILDRLPLAAVFIDPITANITFANQAAHDMLQIQLVGTTPSIRFGKTVTTYDAATGRRHTIDESPSVRAARGEVLRNEEYIVETSMGRRHTSFSSEQIPASNGQSATTILVINDLTQLKNTENELAKAKALAENANAAKSVFLANVSHEVRTPLGAITGFLDLLKSPTIAREDAERYISIIDRNASQLRLIVDDILDLSKVEAGKMIFEKNEFSLVELLSDIDSLLGFRARENGIEFHIEFENAIPIHIISDSTRIRQILINAVGNAVKFTATGEVVLSLSFRDGILKFTVTDTGCGVHPDQAKNLFQPFTQADASMTRRYGGTGLGLALTKSLARGLGGDYVLEKSVPGNGSIFVATVEVELPRNATFAETSQVTERMAAKQVDARVTSSASILDGLKVLVVEDSPDNQALLDIVLKYAGANVAMASNGQEGIDAALRGDYDVVLMDVQMPVLDGHQATRILRERGFKKPIVALTAHAMSEEMERAKASGFSDYLTKPIQRQELLSVLEEYRN